jgi:hypothetical protein
MQGVFFNRKGLFVSDRRVAPTLRGALLLASASLLLISGCASLPDVNRLQNNMDAMVHYMGVMATSMPVMVNSTARMAETAERMEHKSDALLNELQKKGGSAERIVQNYSQALLDNERAMINNLKGIRGELGELKQSLTAAARTPRSEDQERVNAQIMARLGSLDNRLSALTLRMEKINGQPSR